MFNRLLASPFASPTNDQQPKGAHAQQGKGGGLGNGSVGQVVHLTSAAGPTIERSHTEKQLVSCRVGPSHAARSG